MKALTSSTLFVVLVCSATLFSGRLWSQAVTYPPARKDTTVDNFHGTMVADPYRWMEDESSPELKAWIEAQNALTEAYLGQIPFRQKIRERLEELWNYPRFSPPRKKGNTYFTSKNEGLQNQSVVYAQTQLGGASTIVIDPNTLSNDGTVAISGMAFSDDGTLLAYGLSRSGSDWQEIRIRDLRTGKDFDEVIRFCKFAGVAWTKDNQGFYYNRYPDPSTVPAGEQSYNNKVYWHTLGTSQAEDRLVYERPDARELGFSPSLTEDGRYLVLTVWHGSSPKNRIYYRRADSQGDFLRLLDEADASYDFLGNVGSVLYFRTDLGAPRGRIIAIDVERPEPTNWKEILPQTSDVLSTAVAAGNRLVVSYLRDVQHVLHVYTMEGAFVREIPLPAPGTVGGITGSMKDTEMFFAFTSFLYPATIYRYDVASAELSTLYPPAPTFDATAYETRQIFYPSKDGTRIPMFLTYRKGLRLDGSNPVLLNGYGGFNISMLPSFSASRLVWLENGGIYALANLRGGGEYGEEWHSAGMLGKKQTVFDDFIAAAEWLVAEKYSTPSRIGIIGGSNGGLLVAACMLQRPDAFGAVICQVPVTDMLRYHKFTVGRFWTVEYGNAEASAEQFAFLAAYSPLHNVRRGVAYPATLITTADHDDRVVPAHAMKFAATLQARDAGINPILLRVETKAGHGGGKPVSKAIEETTDIYAFLMHRFGMTFSATR